MNSDSVMAYCCLKQIRGLPWTSRNSYQKPCQFQIMSFQNSRIIRPQKVVISLRVASEFPIAQNENPRHSPPPQKF